MYFSKLVKSISIYFSDIDVNFHKLDEYSSSLMKKTQEQSTKKDTFSSVSNY